MEEGLSSSTRDGDGIAEELFQLEKVLQEL